MADSEQQSLRAGGVEELLASSPRSTCDLEHLLWGWQQRVDLLRNLAAHALTGGQPLVASSIYQQVGAIEERIQAIEKNLRTGGNS